MDQLSTFEIVVTTMGSTLSLASILWMLMALRNHVDHLGADSAAVARLVRTAPRDFLENALRKT